MARKQTLPTGLYLRGEKYWLDVTEPGSGIRHRHSLDVKDLPTARAIFEKERSRIFAAAHGCAPKETDVETFKARYLEAASTRLAPAIYTKRKRWLDGFFSFCNVHRLDAIRPEHFTGYAAWRLENGTSYTRTEKAGDKVVTVPVNRVTVRGELKGVRAALAWAVRHDYIERNPADRADALPPDEVNRPIVYLTVEERDRLLAACADPVQLHGRSGKGKGNVRARRTPVGTMAAIAAYAGLRLSEIIWLDWTDIDFDRNEIRVANKEGWRTKTRASRSVPLFPPLRAILEPRKQEAGPLFTTSPTKKYPEGKRYSRHNVFRALGLAAKRSKIAKDVSFNVLRHTFATTLVAAGVQLFAVSRWLGHTTTRVTEQHYAAFAPNAALVTQAAAALAGQAVAPAGKKGRGRKAVGPSA